MVAPIVEAVKMIMNDASIEKFLFLFIFASPVQ
jgi:hypothetical protein